MTVEDLRREIDRIDAELVRLLSERAACAAGIGELKKREGIGMRDTRRELQVLKRIRKLNKGPLNSETLERLYAGIITACRDLEEGER